MISLPNKTKQISHVSVKVTMSKSDNDDDDDGNQKKTNPQVRERERARKKASSFCLSVSLFSRANIALYVNQTMKIRSSPLVLPIKAKKKHPFICFLLSRSLKSVEKKHLLIFLLFFSSPRE